MNEREWLAVRAEVTMLREALVALISLSPAKALVIKALRESEDLAYTQSDVNLEAIPQHAVADAQARLLRRLEELPSSPAQ
jgi:hypothetical protein